MTHHFSSERFTAIYHLTGDEAEARAKAQDLCLEQTVELPDALVTDETLRAQLPPLDGVIKVFDENGQLVGHFLSAKCDLEVLECVRACPYSEEELERFRQETGGRTLDEIWKSLGITA